MFFKSVFTAPAIRARPALQQSRERRTGEAGGSVKICVQKVKIDLRDYVKAQLKGHG
jgi:hypothetical protein